MPAAAPLFRPPPPTPLPDEGQPLRPAPDLFDGHPLHRDTSVEVDGRQVHIRPVRPTDVSAISRFVAGLSLDTRYRRFHTGLKRLTASQLAVLVDVDHRERETLLSFAGGELIGLGQYVRDGQDHAELSLVVADGWQRNGVGRLLAGQLAAAAAEAGIAALGSHVLADNPAPVGLARSLSDSVSVEHRHGDVELTIQLQPC